jgi:uncharacterized membrane protein YfcA
VPKGSLRLVGIFLVACFVGVCGGLVGIGGGALLVPLLVLLFGFDQHWAQGTSLVALVPPTGLLAFVAYYGAHQVDIKVGLLLIPGIFFGGLIGGRIATQLTPKKMRATFAVLLFALGLWQTLSALIK